MLGYLNCQPKQHKQPVFVQQARSLEKPCSLARWIPLSNTWFCGVGGSQGGKQQQQNKKKGHSFPAGHRECEASRAANWRRITLEFFGFGALSLQLMPATESESQVFPHHLCHHFSRQLPLKCHQRKNLSVVRLVYQMS